jgi:hypothetical protein
VKPSVEVMVAKASGLLILFTTVYLKLGLNCNCKKQKKTYLLHKTIYFLKTDISLLLVNKKIRRYF